MPEKNGHEEKLNKRKIRVINLISFLFGFSQAVLAFIVSSYFKEALGTENIGPHYIVIYSIVLLALVNFHRLVKKVGKFYSFLFAISVQIISLFALYLLPVHPAAVVFLAAYIIFGNLTSVSIDFVLESFSVDHMSGRVRGLYLTLLDAGFLLGPIVSTATLDKYHFQGAFLISFIIDIIILLIALARLRQADYHFESRSHIADIVAKVWRRKSVMRIYFISFVLEAFYSVMLTFSPIYLRDLGMSWEEIGLVFTAMLIPFIIFPFPVGFLADTRFGEKEMLIIALFVMGFSTYSIFFINSASLAVWTVALFGTRIGASMIQTLRDSYFYKKIDGHDIDLIDLYRTAVPLAYISAMISSTLILCFFSIKYIFLALSALIFLALWPAFKLRDSR